MVRWFLLCALLVVANVQADGVARSALNVPLAKKAVFMDLAIHKQTIFAVGERGIILSSTDKGNSWEQIASPVDVTLTSIAFTNNGNGWIVGHESTILHSTDNGASWQIEKYQPENERYYLTTRFISEQHGFVLATDGELWETLDGGNSWRLTVLSVEDWYQNHLFGIEKIAGSTLVVAERGGVFNLKKDQQEWQVVPSPYEGSYFGVIKLGENFLIYGMSGRVFLLDAQSLEWKRVEVKTDQFLLDATLSVDGQTALVVGRGGVILIINAAGELVKKVERKSRVDFTSVVLQGDDIYLASMAGGVEKSSFASLMNYGGE
ncbi:MAG: glycosyl hydrolase [Piscirickettsiaceae bacterium]|nr:MAG: glycosyl hydrolase [Piscirickettsiaceae bacterium]